MVLDKNILLSCLSTMNHIDPRIISDLHWVLRITTKQGERPFSFHLQHWNKIPENLRYIEIVSSLKL